MQFSALMELHEKCMISVFPFLNIVWLAFLVNPRTCLLVPGQNCKCSVPHAIQHGWKFFDRRFSISEPVRTWCEPDANLMKNAKNNW